MENTKIHLKIHVHSQEILKSQNNSGKGKQSWRAHTSGFENIIKLQWPSRFLCPWDFPGKNTGVGCHFLLQEIFPTEGVNPGLPHCKQTLYRLSHQGSFYSQEILKSQNNSGKGKQSWRAHTSWFENIIKLQWASQVVLVVKNPPANAGDVRGVGSIPGSGTSSGGAQSNPLQYSCWKIPWTNEPGRLQSIGSQRVRHDWSNLAHTHAHIKL